VRIKFCFKPTRLDRREYFPNGSCRLERSLPQWRAEAGEIAGLSFDWPVNLQNIVIHLVRESQGMPSEICHDVPMTRCVHQTFARRLPGGLNQTGNSHESNP